MDILKFPKKMLEVDTSARKNIYHFYYYFFFFRSVLKKYVISSNL